MRGETNRNFRRTLSDARTDGVAGRLDCERGQGSGSDGARKHTPLAATRPGSKRKEAEARPQSPLVDEAFYTSTSPSAFLNIPFHKEYELLALAYVAALVCLGIEPVIIEDYRNEGRLTELVRLIGSCEFSLHDMSFVGRDGRFNVPRFNMPFEYGLASAILVLRRESIPPGPPHWIAVFEKVRYRIQASLSDCGGIDARIHRGTQKGVIREVLSAFPGRRRESVTPLVVDKVLRQLRGHYLRIKEKERHGWIFDPRCFYKVAFTARQIFEELCGNPMQGASGTRGRG